MWLPLINFTESLSCLTVTELPLNFSPCSPAFWKSFLDPLPQFSINTGNSHCDSVKTWGSSCYLPTYSLYQVIFLKSQQSLENVPQRPTWSECCCLSPHCCYSTYLTSVISLLCVIHIVLTAPPTYQRSSCLGCFALAIASVVHCGRFLLA